MTDPVLTVSRLHLVIERARQRFPILRGVKLSIMPGEVRGLVGESGAGKTMIGRAIAGILPESARITEGRIAFEGRELINMPAVERRRLLGKSIAMILQNPMTALNPVLRIENQIVDVLQRRMHMSRANARVRALELLDRVRIRAPARVLQQYPHELSGGMCQRVVIAIAFSCGPKLVVADEPTTALDVTVQFQILRLIKDMQRDTAASVLFITHDLGVVAKMCDSVSIAFAGRILEEGATERIFADPQSAYTRALLAATPRYDQPERGLEPVPSEITDRLWRDATAYDAEHANH